MASASVPPVYEGSGAVVVLGVFGGSTLRVPYPSGISTNDILIVQVTTYDINVNISGFTSAGFSAITNVTVGATYVNFYWKRATGSESGNLNLSISGSTTVGMGVIHRFSGVVTSGIPFINSYNTGTINNTVLTLSGRTITNDTSLGVVLYIQADNTSTTVTLNGWTQNYTYSTSEGPDAYHKMCSIAPGAGTPPTLTFTVSSTEIQTATFIELLAA